MVDIVSRDGGLWVGDERVHLKGTSWFGFETPDACVHGLWAHTIDWFLDFLQEHGFNAIRIPFSMQLALNPDTQPATINASINSDLVGLSSIQVMDRVIDKVCTGITICSFKWWTHPQAGERGMVAMLDNHRLAANNGAYERS